MAITRPLALAIAASALVVIAGCGGSKQHAVAGLPLWQRVLQGGELPGFDSPMQPPPNFSLGQFVSQAKPIFVRITAASARKELTADGFRLATLAPLSSGKNSPLVASTVIWVGSAEQARRVVDWDALDSLQSCLHVCNATIEEFKVPGIPGARGSHRFRGRNTPGAGGSQPFESYNIVFANESFVYDLFVLGAKPGALKQDDLIHAAKAQYKRVEGAPLPRFLVKRGSPPVRKP